MTGWELQETAKAALRWIHVFAAFLWVGQTYLFNFFERQIRRGEGAGEKPNVAGSLWLVHGGGFYLVEKQVRPEILPKRLHWFKWEAATTWLSGVGLVALTYYAGGILVEPGQSWRRGAAIGIGMLIVGWVVYDLLVRSSLGRHPLSMAGVGLVGLLAVHRGLLEVMSSRSAFLHVGALMGTIMAANVWMRILPSQRKMLAAVRAGTEPDPRLSATGPLRSKHNSYMAVPLVFVMISNHYPTISYGSSHSTAILGGLLVVGWGVARILRDGWRG